MANCEIRIQGNFYLVSDSHCWKIAEKKKKKNKDGVMEDSFDYLTYHSTEIQALESYKRKLLRESGVTKFKDLVETKQKIYTKLEKLIIDLTEMGKKKKSKKEDKK